MSNAEARPRTDVSGWSEYDNVDLGSKNTSQDTRGTQVHIHTNSYASVVQTHAKINWYKCYPDNTCRVHYESNALCFVETRGYLASAVSTDCAGQDQYDVAAISNNKIVSGNSTQPQNLVAKILVFEGYGFHKQSSYGEQCLYKNYNQQYQ